MKKKTLATLLMLSLVTGLLAGCGQTEPTQKESEPVAATDSKEEVTEEATESSDAGEEAFDQRSITEGKKITIAAKDSARILDYNTNWMVLQAEEALGLDIEFITFPSADYETKINLMINSGEKLPDIIFSPPSVDALVAEGVVQPITEWFTDPNYMPNVNKFCEEVCDLSTLMRTAEGEINGFPNFGRAGDQWEKLHIYKPWLDALGEDMPETIEDYYELLKKVSETDLNGNGKKDEIGLIGITSDPDYTYWTHGWFATLMTPYVYAWNGDRCYVYPENGELKFAMEQDEWKEGMKFIRKFFEEGLIATETLVYTKEEQVDVIQYAEEQVLFSWINSRWRGNDAERGGGYYMVGPLAGADGKAVAKYMADSYTIKSVLTTDCENPEVACILMDFWGSEEMTITNRYGKQGVDWDYWDVAKTKIDNPDAWAANVNVRSMEMRGTDEPLFAAYDDATYWTAEEPQNHGMRESGIRLYWDSIAYGVVTGPKVEIDAATDPITAERTEWWNEAIYNGYISSDCQPEEGIGTLPMTIDETNRVAELCPEISDYVEEMKTAWLSGEKDIDATWDEFQAELKKLGTEELLAIYQTAYDRVK